MADARGAHVILVGLPGAGKSTVARDVAARLACDFVDVDGEIEGREGLHVAEIFARHGEAYFRDAEREVSRLLREREPAMIAPGAGWMSNRAASALLRPAGRIIYLAVTPERALARMGASRNARPLLDVADPAGALRALLAARAADYESADVQIDTEAMTRQDVTDRVASLAAAFWEMVG